MQKRGILATLVAVMTAVALLVIPASAANAAIGPPLPTDHTTYISVKTPPGYSGKKVIDIKDWSQVNGGAAQLWALRTTGNVSNQRWRIIKYMVLYTTGYPIDVVYLQNVNSGKCLDKSYSGGDYDGAPVYQYTCSFSDNQLWEYFPSTTDKWGELANMRDGRCLDVRAASFTDGASLQAWSCTNQWNQRFNLY